jgi:hypothetical protein
MPVIRTRIEERHDATGTRVSSFYGGLFVIVAPETTQAEVVKMVRAAARCRDNMINRELMPGILHA